MPDFEQTDFASILFPGRKTLRVSEAAEHLHCTEQHIIDLIDEGVLGAVNIAAGDLRRHYRIPVSEWDKFLRRRDAKLSPQ